MAEEQKQEQNGAQTSQDVKQEQTSEKKTREDHMAAEINKLRKQLESQNAAIAAKEAEESKRVEEARQKKLEDEGNYKTAMAEKDAKIAALEKSHAAEVRRLTLKAKLSGMDPLAMKGAIAECPDDVDIDVYVENIRKDHAHLFAGFSDPQRTVAQGARSGNGTTKSLRDRLAERDPETMKKVFQDALAGKTIVMD